MWRAFKQDVHMLAKSLSDYASYLREQNKSAHCSMDPIRSLAENLYFQLNVKHLYRPERLRKLEMFEFV